MDDELFWDLLEEQHNHDVVMTPSRKDGAGTISDWKVDIEEMPE